MKNFLKVVGVYVGAFFLAQRACVAYILLLFKYAFICIPNTGRHIRIMNKGCSFPYVFFPPRSNFSNIKGKYR